MDINGLMEQLQNQKEKVLMRKSYQILKKLFDENSFIQIDEFSMSYQDFTEIICGFGAVHGRPVYAFCQDVDVSGGAISKQHINKLKKLYSLAEKTGVPVVGIYHSAGMRLLDGEDLLIEMGSLITSGLNLSKRVPMISIVLGPCLGLNCILAKSADILIASKNAQISIDVRNTDAICENSQHEDVVDILVQNDDEALSEARDLIMILPSNNTSPAPVKPVKEPDNSQFDGFNKVIYKIYNNEPYDIKSEIIDMVFDRNSFIEFSNGYVQAFCMGFAKLGGITTGVIASNNIKNDGFIELNDGKKVERFIKFCNRFSIPIISFLDSKEFKSAQCAIDLYNAYCMTDVAKFNVILGEFYGALASAVLSDNCCQSTTIAWPCAKISLLPYKAMANIIYNDELKQSKNPVMDRKNFISRFAEQSTNPLVIAEKGLISDVIDPLETRRKLFSLLELFYIPNALKGLK